jgi:hypothetical protein
MISPDPPLLSVDTRRKFLGANYGFAVIPAAALNSRLEAPRFGLHLGLLRGGEFCLARGFQVGLSFGFGCL